MYMHEPVKIIGEAVEAQGGEALWRGLKAIEATISARGFLFTAKRRPVLERVNVRADAHKPHFTFYDFPEAGQKSELIGINEVRIAGNDGIVIKSRKEPRLYFRE